MPETLLRGATLGPFRSHVATESTLQALLEHLFSDSLPALDFSHSRRVANRLGQAFHEGSWDFHRVGRPRRPAKSLLLLMGPQLFSHQPERIGESRMGLVVYSHWMPSMGRNTADGIDEALG